MTVQGTMKSALIEKYGMISSVVITVGKVCIFSSVYLFTSNNLGVSEMIAKLIIALAFYMLYWFICFLGTGTDRKNLVGLRSYPDSVQQAVYNHPTWGSIAPKEKSILSILLSNMVLFTAIFFVMGLVLKNILGLNDFSTAFLFFLALGEGLGLFDLLIIDLLWWRNTKRIRFSFLPDKSHYQDPSKHIASFLRGIPLFLVVALLAAVILSV